MRFIIYNFILKILQKFNISSSFIPNLLVSGDSEIKVVKVIFCFTFNLDFLICSVINEVLRYYFFG